ncbi:hypothetical protein RJ639_042132 [Escallonia herrerae]|uniref:Probable N-acetyl-gamma-glutamyl-phosphate reductase, chloroplastic n=1 Tax=Escallonia herrerae TaxID=1293975 RepID=A0AA89B1L7_9ASTE|nr:hypothetical protein RJ639_042132 [Escallonia herrerae]
MDLCTKDFELLILVSEFKLMAVQKANVEKEQIRYSAVLETLKKDIVLVNINAELKDWILQDKDIEIAVLQKEAEVVQREQQALLSALEQRDLEIFQTKKANRAFEQDIELLKEAACSSFTLKAELDAVMEAKWGLSSQVKKLEEDLKMKEAGLEIFCRISVMDEQNAMLQENLCVLETSLCKLQTELEAKDTESTKTRSLEEENESLQSELRKLKAEYHMLFQDMEEKKSDVESSIKGMEEAGKEIHRLQSDLSTVNEELNELRLHESVLVNELRSKTHDFQIQVDKIKTLSKENILLRDELRSHENVKYGALKASSSNMLQCIDSVENIDVVSSRVAEVLNRKYVVLEKMFQEMCKNVESTSKFISEVTSLENFAKELTSVNLSLQTELERKDEVLEGLLFDLRLLQESASSTKDQKDENEELVASLEALDYELAVQSNELDEAVDKGQKLEAQLQEKTNLICTLELDFAKEREAVILLSRKNLELIDNIEDALKAKASVEEELTEKRKDNESLEMELTEMGSALEKMNKLIESLKRNLSSVTSERDDLNADLLALKKEFEMARALAEENEAIATEARQVAETRKVYAEDKEEEVRLLERSVEELECTVNVLENKQHGFPIFQADIVKEEAERQRLQREELELELHTVKQQLHNVESNDADMKRHLDEKQKNLQETLQRIWVLEREVASKNAEIDQCKAHITELNLHAEAQACEYKQKYLFSYVCFGIWKQFKALEAMAEQVKPEGSATHIKSEKDEEFTAGSKHGYKSTNKLEKNGSKPRGSGSPFKCIGLGLAQQIKSEKDEELTAGRCRIEELEALAASRQKEIFSLNARLAAAESMTHDVIRDLLGLKLDMNNYASLLDNQQLQRIAEKAQLYYAEAQVKEQEAVKLKQQLNGFIEERRGWLEEIDRKQAELVAAQFALEKLHQQDRLLATENEMFKMENVNYKKKVMELEAEVKNLSGQQNLHQRIHHHAKIKAKDLSSKLRRTEGVLSRVKEELAHFRAANGRSPYINFDNEQRLTDKLKKVDDPSLVTLKQEIDEERLQLAQKLVALCASILKATGVTRPKSDINIFEAEEALEQLKNRISSLERELLDLRYKDEGKSNQVRKLCIRGTVASTPQSLQVSRAEAHNKSEKTVRIGVLGASGYTGSEIVRLLANHPYFDITLMTADRKAGQSIGSVFPHLGTQDLPDMVAVKDADFSDVDAVFCCLPHGTTQEIIKGLPNRLKIVDLSADFRLRDIGEYEEWYGQPHKAPVLQKEAVYGLTEISRSAIQNARLVANPGCYPTSIQLPLVPLIEASLIEVNNIIIDAKSGVSGAGRGAKEANLYTEIAEGIHSYGITRHRHVPEIEQGLSDASNGKVTVSFTPHLMPMSRGMQSTMYVQMAPGVSHEDLYGHLKTIYEDEEFIVVLKDNEVPHTRHVRGSNYCLMNVFPDRISGRAIIISVIDNLVKGASGQALQNLNLMMGVPETTGLLSMPLFP